MQLSDWSQKRSMNYSSKAWELLLFSVMGGQLSSTSVLATPPHIETLENIRSCLRLVASRAIFTLTEKAIVKTLFFNQLERESHSSALLPQGLSQVSVLFREVYIHKWAVIYMVKASAI